MLKAKTIELRSQIQQIKPIQQLVLSEHVVPFSVKGMILFSFSVLGGFEF